MKQFYHNKFIFTNLLRKQIILSFDTYNDGIFVFEDISGGKLQVGDKTDSGGFVLKSLFSGVATIPSSFGGKTVTLLSDHSFRACKSLTGVVFPTTIEEIGYAALYDSNNIEFVNFSSPSSLKTIGSYSFGLLTIIETIIIPSSVETIMNGAFWYCAKLTNFYYCGSSDLRSISNCFQGSPLVSRVFVTSSYPYGTFASKNVEVVPFCPSQDLPSHYIIHSQPKTPLYYCSNLHSIRIIIPFFVNTILFIC